MEEALDMSLDDLIKKNKKRRAENQNASFRLIRRGGGRENFRANSSVYRPPRPLPAYRGHAVATPYPGYPPNSTWLRMREGPTIQEDASGHYAGTKLYLSNLDPGVSHKDIKVLFSDVGELKRYAIHYDISGKPQGTAEVVYARRSEALSAIRKYDNLLLDGKPIKIELIGSDTPPAADGLLQCGITFRSNNSGRWGLGLGQTSEAKKERHEKVSAEGLDADLEKYNQFG